MELIELHVNVCAVV